MVSEKLVRATTLGAAAIFALALSVTQSMAQDKGKGACSETGCAAQPAAAGERSQISGTNSALMCRFLSRRKRAKSPKSLKN